MVSLTFDGFDERYIIIIYNDALHTHPLVQQRLIVSKTHVVSLLISILYFIYASVGTYLYTRKFCFHPTRSRERFNYSRVF